MGKREHGGKQRSIRSSWRGGAETWECAPVCVFMCF